MHFDLVILYNKEINNKVLENLNYKILSEDHYLIDDHNLNNNISFDYAIIYNKSALKNIDILEDEGSIICNFFFQTNIDHIFFIGKENNSKKTINEQVNIVLEFLI